MRWIIMPQEYGAFASVVMQIEGRTKWYVFLQWCFQQIESLIKLITPCLQAPPS